MREQGAAAYHEFNFSPSGEWAAYAFTRYREGRTLTDEVLNPQIAVQSGVARLDLYALVDLARLSAGHVRARLTVGLGHATFFYGARLFWHSYDFFYSEMKAWAFGLLIPLISVHMGLLTRGGAEGVGRSTTASVVFMIIAVLVCDALFPPLFLN